MSCCSRCGASSSHPDDIREGYCARCHEFTWAPEEADPVMHHCPDCGRDFGVPPGHHGIVLCGYHSPPRQMLRLSSPPDGSYGIPQLLAASWAQDPASLALSALAAHDGSGSYARRPAAEPVTAPYEYGPDAGTAARWQAGDPVL